MPVLVVQALQKVERVFLFTPLLLFFSITFTVFAAKNAVHHGNEKKKRTKKMKWKNRNVQVIIFSINNLRSVLLFFFSYSNVDNSHFES